MIIVLKEMSVLDFVFLYQESEGSIPFFYTLISRKPDGSVKLTIYRKKTHPDQYLQFNSHHPLHQKFGVGRTLLDRCDSLVTDQEDKIAEEENIKGALLRCGYPERSLKKVKLEKATVATGKANNEQEKSKLLVVLP